MDEIQYKIYIDDVIRRVETARLKVSGHHIVKIVAVSKYSSSDEIEKLYKIGQRAFGENKVQDLRAKTQELEDLPLEWHFIGNLQKNKINNLLDINPTLFQSLDSIELANELQKKLAAKEMTLDCLIQINSAKEESKHGFMP
jgi:pyridoxal phosphate enzyme (YggS family)